MLTITYWVLQFSDARRQQPLPTVIKIEISKEEKMAKFPRTELEVIALANGLIAGLTANSTVYPSPPLTIEELTANLNKVIAS